MGAASTAGVSNNDKQEIRIPVEARIRSGLPGCGVMERCDDEKAESARMVLPSV